MLVETDGTCVLMPVVGFVWVSTVSVIPNGKGVEEMDGMEENGDEEERDNRCDSDVDLIVVSILLRLVVIC